MPNAPQQIGKYEIRRELGKGAMGVVFEGYDPDCDRRVAIKAVHEHLLGNPDGPEFLARLQREAQAAARCSHPNIVTVLEYGRDQGMHFIAMEYIDGMKLTERLRGAQLFEMREVLAIMSQLLKALHAAHRHDIVHRDVKPDNVILLANGTVKLADFGIARLPSSDFTRVGMFMGTPRFCAPEQSEGGEVGPYSDIFSLGLIFADMVCHTRLPAHLEVSTVPRIEGLHPVHKVNYRQPIPSVLVPVVVRSLQPSYTDRIKSALEFAHLIKAVVPVLQNQVKPQPASRSIVDADATHVAPPAIDKADKRRIEHILMEYLGPVAASVVQVAAQRAADISELTNAIAEEIADPADRKEFLRRVSLDTAPPPTVMRPIAFTALATAPAPPQKAAEPAIPPETIRRLREDFVNYVGPMASTIINEHISQGSGYSVLVRQMAEYISSEQERQQFLNHWRT
jgi:eukaryotic-like serine/threonine-protein kinase